LYTYNGPARSQWQTHKKNPVVSNEGRARAKKGGISGILRTAIQEKFYCKPMVPMASIHSEGVHFRRSQPHQISTTPNGLKTNPKNWVPEIRVIHITTEVQKFVEYNGEITFQIRATLAEILPENCF